MLLAMLWCALFLLLWVAGAHNRACVADLPTVAICGNVILRVACVLHVATW